MTDTTELARQRLADTSGSRTRCSLRCGSWSGDHWVTHTESARIGARQPEHRAGPVRARGRWPARSRRSDPVGDERRQGVATHPRRRAPPDPPPHRRRSASRTRATGGDRHARRRDDEGRGARRRRQVRRLLRVLRRLDRQAQRRRGADVPGTRAGLHDARAVRRRVGDDQLERAADVHGAKGRRGAGGRQLGGRQVTGVGPVRARAVRRDLPGGRAPRRCAQPPQRWPRGRLDAGQPSGHRQDLVHRERIHGAEGDERSCGQPHPRRPGAGRQVGQSGVRGRRPGCGRRDGGDVRGRAWLRAGLSAPDPAAGAEVRLPGRRRARRRQAARHPGRRSAARRASRHGSGHRPERL